MQDDVEVTVAVYVLQREVVSINSRKLHIAAVDLRSIEFCCRKDHDGNDALTLDVNRVAGAPWLNVDVHLLNVDQTRGKRR